MAKVVIGGVEYPVSVTFGAIASYLESVGEDSAEGLAAFYQLPPSRYPAFIVACVNEGLRAEGSEERITVEEVSACSIMEVGNAAAILFREMTPKSSPGEKKKD